MSIEEDFIREVYPDWSVPEIAEKLEMRREDVSKMIDSLGIKVHESARRQKHDWASMWYAWRETGNCRQAAFALGVKHQHVWYAIKQMAPMSRQERMTRWNRYARKNGRPEYTLEECA